MNKLSLLFSSAFFGLALVACGGGSGETGGDGNGGDETSGGDAAAQYAGPVTGDATAGAETFDSICTACHEEGGIGPALDNIGWDAARVRQQVREGSGQMAPLNESRVTPEALENILAHMQSIGAVQ